MNKSLTKSELALARKIESNYMASYRYAHGVDGAVFWEDDTVAGFLTGYPEPSMNWVQKFKIDPQSPADDVKQVLARFNERQCPMSWFIGVHTATPEKVKECLQEQKFETSSDSNYFAMALERTRFAYSGNRSSKHILALVGRDLGT